MAAFDERLPLELRPKHYSAVRLQELLCGRLALAQEILPTEPGFERALLDSPHRWLWLPDRPVANQATIIFLSDEVLACCNAARGRISLRFLALSLYLAI